MPRAPKRAEIERTFSSSHIPIHLAGDGGLFPTSSQHSRTLCRSARNRTMSYFITCAYTCGLLVLAIENVLSKLNAVTDFHPWYVSQRYIEQKLTSGKPPALTTSIRISRRTTNATTLQTSPANSTPQTNTRQRGFESATK